MISTVKDQPQIDAATRPGSDGWRTKVLQEIAILSKLKENWDGFGSPTPRPPAVHAATELLVAVHADGVPAPFIGPVTGGGIGIAWEIAPRRLEFEILPDGAVDYWTMVAKEAVCEGNLPAERIGESGLLVNQLVNWLINK